MAEMRNSVTCSGELKKILMIVLTLETVLGELGTHWGWLPTQAL